MGAVVDGDSDDSGASGEPDGFGLGEALDVKEAGVVPVVPPASPSPVFAFFSVSAVRLAACFLQAEAWTASSSILALASLRSPSGMVASTSFCW